MITLSGWEPNWIVALVCAGVLIAFWIEEKLHRSIRELDRKRDRFIDDERRAFDAVLEGRCLVCRESLESVVARFQENEARR